MTDNGVVRFDIFYFLQLDLIDTPTQYTTTPIKTVYILFWEAFGV